MARTKKDSGDVEGRALVDIPAHDLKSGDYATLPAEVAQALESAGMFDTQAKPVKS